MSSVKTSFQAVGSLIVWSLDEGCLQEGDMILGEAALFVEGQVPERTHKGTICSQHFRQLGRGSERLCAQVTTASNTVQLLCCLDPPASYCKSPAPGRGSSRTFPGKMTKGKLVGQIVAPATMARVEAISGSHHLPCLLSIRVHFISILCPFHPLLAPPLV